LFTSRNQAAQGLRLPKTNITDCRVAALPQDAAKRVLLAGGVQLSQQQLGTALEFCGGLPLALQLLHGALQAAGGNANSILQRIRANSNINWDKSETLWELLTFSVECLSEELQDTWLDLVQGFGSSSWTSSEFVWLQCMFEPAALQDLQQRNLIVIEYRVAAGHMYGIGESDVNVIVHDVLRRMASRMCESGSKKDQYYAAAGSKVSIPALKVKCHRCHACCQVQLAHTNMYV
jgi:hypothetical protein